MAIETTQLPSNGMTPSEKRHLGALEKRIATGLQTFREVGAALLEIRDSRLYRETHTTFEAYCAERWALNRVRAYQLIDSAKVVSVLGDPAGLRNESQARELAPLASENPEEAKRVWSEVQSRADQSHRPVTASLIRQVLTESTADGRPAPAVPTPAERLAMDMARVVNTYRRWLETKPSKADVRMVNAAKKSLIEALG
jgi:hypothetical protein